MDRDALPKAHPKANPKKPPKKPTKADEDPKKKKRGQDAEPDLKEVKCFYCKQKGHKKTECPKRKADMKKAKEQGVANANALPKQEPEAEIIASLSHADSSSPSQDSEECEHDFVFALPEAKQSRFQRVTNAFMSVVIKLGLVCGCYKPPEEYPCWPAVLYFVETVKQDKVDGRLMLCQSSLPS